LFNTPEVAYENAALRVKPNEFTNTLALDTFLVTKHSWNLTRA